MIRGSLERPDRLSVSLPRGCDPTGCRFKDRRTHKRHLVSLFHYPVFREHLPLGPRGAVTPARPGPSRGGRLIPARRSRQVFFDEDLFQSRWMLDTWSCYPPSAGTVVQMEGCDTAGRLSGSSWSSAEALSFEVPAAGWLSAGGGVYPEPCSPSSAVCGILSVSVFSWLSAAEAVENAEAEEQA